MIHQINFTGIFITLWLNLSICQTHPRQMLIRVNSANLPTVLMVFINSISNSSGQLLVRLTVRGLVKYSEYIIAGKLSNFGMRKWLVQDHSQLS